MAETNPVLAAAAVLKERSEGRYEPDFEPDEDEESDSVTSVEGSDDGAARPKPGAKKAAAKKAAKKASAVEEDDADGDDEDDDDADAAENEEEEEEEDEEEDDDDDDDDDDEDSSDDAEDEEEDEDDDEDDDDGLEDPLVLKVRLDAGGAAGAVPAPLQKTKPKLRWSILRVDNETKLAAFRRVVAEHVGLAKAQARDALLYYHPSPPAPKKGAKKMSAAAQAAAAEAAPRLPIATAKQLQQAKDSFWGGSATHLRVVVELPERLDVDGSPAGSPAPAALPAAGAGADAAASSSSPRTTTTPVVGGSAAARRSAAAAAAMASPAMSSEMMLSGSYTASSGMLLNGTVRQEIDALSPDEELKWTAMRSLGSGAYGQVFEALTDGGKLIAVKHLVVPSDAPACMASSNKAAEELISEIRLLKRLRHRHIVEYYGCQTKTEDNGTRIINIFLEHCHGGSINALRRRYDKEHGRLSVALVRNYTRQVLLGLEYLHRKGVVHRDLKGDNVLIGANGDAKLADFGCSKQVSTSLAKTQDMGGVDSGTPHKGPTDAQCKTLVGTPLFMAPEVLREQTDGYSSSADVWSIGCLVLELFGHRPWKVQGATLFSVMYAVATAKTLPTGMPTECPAPLFDFLEQCFKREPGERPSCSKLLRHPWITCPDRELEEPKWAEPTA